MRLIRGCLALAAALMLSAAPGAAMGEEMRVFVEEGALEREEATRLVVLLGEAFPEAEWTAVFEEEETDLRTLVMEDRTPQLAICSPLSVSPWAKEGMLMPLEGCVADLSRMQQQVVDACVWDETLLMAPLRAGHRQMAVNRKLMEIRHFSYMMDALDHPVWYPSEINQILEEFSVAGTPAIELWPDENGGSAALEALVQSIYCGALLSEDGTKCLADGGGVLAGLTWLRDMVAGGTVVYVKDRQTALDRFLAGETALFIDWTDEEDRRLSGKLRSSGVELEVMPYPSAAGYPVRSFDLTGLCAFKGASGAQEELMRDAIAFLCEDVKAQIVLGDRAIWQDDAIWLPCMTATDRGMTLRKLFAEAIDAVMEGGKTPEQALSALAATMNAIP